MQVKNSGGKKEVSHRQVQGGGERAWVGELIVSGEGSSSARGAEEWVGGDKRRPDFGGRMHSPLHTQQRLGGRRT